MTGTDRDPDVDSWLRESRRLRRADSAADALEPPAGLDDVVLAQARRECLQSVRPRRVFFRDSRWSARVAIAATVLLSFTLVLQINRFESPGNFAAPADAPVVQPPPSTAAEAPPAMAATPAMAPSVARAGYRPRGHEERKRGDARHEVAPAAGREQDVAAPAAFNAAARVSIPAGVMAEQATADAAARDPQEWWALVQRLRQQGHPEEATRELEALRRAYPDFVPPR